MSQHSKPLVVLLWLLLLQVCVLTEIGFRDMHLVFVGSLRSVMIEEDVTEFATFLSPVAQKSVCAEILAGIFRSAFWLFT